MKAKKKVKRWKQYLEELYNGNLDESVLEKDNSIEKHDKDQYILQSKFDAAIEYIKDNNYYITYTMSLLIKPIDNRHYFR